MCGCQGSQPPPRTTEQKTAATRPVLEQRTVGGWQGATPQRDREPVTAGK